MGTYLKWVTITGGGFMKKILAVFAAGLWKLVRTLKLIKMKLFMLQ